MGICDAVWRNKPWNMVSMTELTARPKLARLVQLRWGLSGIGRCAAGTADNILPSMARCSAMVVLPLNVPPFVVAVALKHVAKSIHTAGTQRPNAPFDRSFICQGWQQGQDHSPENAAYAFWKVVLFCTCDHECCSAALLQTLRSAP